MDVEDFLERELAGLGLETIPEIGPLKKAEPKPITSKTALDKAEKDYMEFWQKIALHEVKWDKESYDNMINMTRQFSLELNKGSQELKAKKETILSQVGRVRALLKENKKELAMKSFSETQSIADSIPGVFFEEKKVITDAVNELAGEIKQFEDNESMRNAYSSMGQIGQLIEQTMKSIATNDMQNASMLYSSAIQAFVKLPEGFSIHKFRIGAKLLEIYKRISIHNEISQLQRHLQNQGTPQGASNAPGSPINSQKAAVSKGPQPINLKSLSMN